MDEERFGDVVRTLQDADETAETWTAPLVDALGVDGASVATLGRVLGSETISASSPLAAKLDELQFDLGEGPCWDALNTGQPVLEADLKHRSEQTWPAFSAAAQDHQVGAMFVFPLRVGPLALGAVDLYTALPGQLGQAQQEQAKILAVSISRLVLRRAIRLSTPETDVDTSPFTRRVVHQATGMVLSQLRIRPDDAYLLIQGQAFAQGRSMNDVASDIVEGTTRFSRTGKGIEIHP